MSYDYEFDLPDGRNVGVRIFSRRAPKRPYYEVYVDGKKRPGIYDLPRGPLENLEGVVLRNSVLKKLK